MPQHILPDEHEWLTRKRHVKDFLMRIGFSFEVKHQPITVRAHKPGDKTKAGNFRKIRNDSTLFCAVEATPQWPRDFARKYCTAPIALSEHFCVVSLWRIDNGHFLQAQNELQGNVSVSMMRNPAPKNQAAIGDTGVFVFDNIFVTTPGRYALKFSVTESLQDEGGNTYAMVVGDLRSDQFEVRPTNFEGSLAPKEVPDWLQYMKDHGSKHKFPKQQNRNPGKRSASDEFKVGEKRQKTTPTMGEDVTGKIKKRSRKSSKSSKSSSGKPKRAGRRASAPRVDAITADHHQAEQDGRSLGIFFAHRDALVDNTASQESMALLHNNPFHSAVYPNWHPQAHQSFQQTAPYPMMMPATTLPQGMDQFGSLTQATQDFNFERPYTHNQVAPAFQNAGQPFGYNAMTQPMEPYTSGGVLPSLHTLPHDMAFTNASLAPAMGPGLSNSQSGTDVEDASYDNSQLEEDADYQQRGGPYPPTGPYNQFDWRYHQQFPGDGRQ